MGLLQAISFLTVIRIGKAELHDDKEVASWGRYFFFVGLLIGAAACGLDHLMMKRFSPLVSSTFIVLFIVIVTGGLHLDGLSDTFDAVFSMKSKEEKLRIMRDSGIGAFGVIAIVFAIILKILLLSELPEPDRMSTILVFPAISRVSLLLPALIYEYPRVTGKGAGFVKYMTPAVLLFGFAVSLVTLFFIMQIKGVVMLISAFVFSLLMAHIFSRRIGGITGDMLGAVNELTGIFVLLIAILL